MNMFAKNKATSVREYLSNVPDERKKDMDFLHDFIQKAVPSLKAHYASNMIGYGSFKYVGAKKKVMDWPIISLANQKNYISVFVCACVKGQDYPLEKYAKKLGKVTLGRSCISFKKVDDVNLDTLKKVLQIAEKSPGLAGATLV